MVVSPHCIVLGMKRVCEQDGCSHPVIGLGFCESHYRHLKSETADHCAIDGCHKPARARGWCNAHYKRWRKCGDPQGTLRKFTQDGDIEERFWARVARDGDGCWEWLASRSAHGYGYFYYQSKVYKAHRLSYTLENGSIPEGLSVLHRCDNPPCVNPKHLYAGTQTDNMRDRELRRKGFSPRLDTT